MSNLTKLVPKPSKSNKRFYGALSTSSEGINNSYTVKNFVDFLKSIFKNFKNFLLGEQISDDEKRKLFDFMHVTVGDFGKWQFRISLLMSLLKLPIAWFQLGIIFLAPPTEFWCRKPQDFKDMNLTTWLKFIAPNVNVSRHHVSRYSILKITVL